MFKIKKDTIIVAVATLMFAIMLSIITILVINSDNSSIIADAKNEGGQEIIDYITAQAIQCKTIPINVDNLTINLVAIECLQQENPS